ncbi:uncharacterized protein [Gossypium hirsutum]|uniref:Uncharacterized protein n=1 Tax=Gossypium hirsutum TaxID=3635 RepID=A0ABM3AMP8_GOSHI|nr:uncharacterized protein LOC121220743 [Gossypium hirsutum]
MCTQFEDDLNEDIKLLVGILKLKEFVVLVDRAHKAKELSKAKRKVDSEARDTGKKPMGKSFSSPSKKLKEFQSRASALVGFSGRDKGKQHLSLRPQATSVASIKSASIFKTKENPFSSSPSFIFVSIFSLSIFLNSVVSIFDAFSSKDRVGTVLQLQVLSLALLFLLYSALGLLNNKKGSYFWPDPVLELVLLLAFVEEFLLYYLQRNDTSGIENRYFDLLCVPIAICVVSTMLELRSNRSIYSKSVRGIGLILHGTWFVQMGFSFYTNLMVHGCSLHEKSRGNYTIKCRSHPDYHRARSIATLQFNCHLALLVVLVVGMLSLIGKRNGVAVANG